MGLVYVFLDNRFGGRWCFFVLFVDDKGNYFKFNGECIGGREFALSCLLCVL